MNYRKEEQRVKAVVDSLIPAILPVGHSRVKWDKVSTDFMVRVVSNFGHFLDYDMIRDK